MRLVEFRPRPKARSIALVIFWVMLSLRLVLAALDWFAGLVLLGTVTLELIQFVILVAAFFIVPSFSGNVDHNSKNKRVPFFSGHVDHNSKNKGVPFFSRFVDHKSENKGVRKRHAWFYSILVVLLILNSVLLILHNDGAEYAFSSPGRTNTLIIEEKSALISSGWTPLYQRQYGVFKRRLSQRLGAYDEYQPFAHGQYRIEWLTESEVQIHYYNGHGYEVVTVEL